MRSKNHKNSLPLKIPITRSCWYARVPKDCTRDFECILSSSTKIWCMKFHYTQEENEVMKKDPVDASF